MSTKKAKIYPVEMGRGDKLHNFQHALVTSKVCRTRREENRKAYRRKAKHRSQEGFAIAA